MPASRKNKIDARRIQAAPGFQQARQILPRFDVPDIKQKRPVNRISHADGLFVFFRTCDTKLFPGGERYDEGPRSVDPRPFQHIPPGRLGVAQDPGGMRNAAAENSGHPQPARARVPLGMFHQAQIVNRQDIGNPHPEGRDAVGEMTQVRVVPRQDCRQPDLHPYLLYGERTFLSGDQVGTRVPGKGKVREEKEPGFGEGSAQRLEQGGRIVPHSGQVPAYRTAVIADLHHRTPPRRNPRQPHASSRTTGPASARRAEMSV